MLPSLGLIGMSYFGMLSPAFLWPYGCLVALIAVIRTVQPLRWTRGQVAIRQLSDGDFSGDLSAGSKCEARKEVKTTHTGTSQEHID